MKYLLLTIFFSLVISCKITAPEDPIAPKRVMMVERVDGADTLESMHGISALPGSENRIRIMWHKPAINENIKSFRIFRSTDSDGLVYYYQYVTIEVDNPGNPDTTFTDLHVDIGTHYHYFITAVNDDGLESASSDTVSLKLLEKASLRGPQSGVTITEKEAITFQWYRAHVAPYYILRVEEYYSETMHPLVYINKYFVYNYDDYQEFVLSKEVVEDVLKDGRNYRWRVDSVEDAESPVNNPSVKIYAESQSEYFTFKVNWNNK
jgi:hypothetical protein